MLFPIVPTFVIPPFAQLYTRTLNATANWAGRAVVLITPITITGFTTFRLRVRNGTDTTATITDMYLGEITGTYSFGAAPTQVTNGVNLTSFAFTASGQAITSNEISYTPSVSGNKLGIAFHVASNNSTLAVRENNGTGWATYQKVSASSDSSTQSKTGYTTGGTQRTALVELVEAR